MSDRPNIPNAVKRIVRQRCGYGCVICGFPIVEYDHMAGGWSTTRRHVAEEITLLCPNHHSEKTRGFLSAKSVELADSRPANLQTAFTPGYAMAYGDSAITVQIGTTEFTLRRGMRRFVGVVVDGIPVFSTRVESGRHLVSVVVLDLANRVQLLLDDNELRFKTSNWDAEFIGSTLTIRHGPRDVALRVRFSVPDRVIFDRGRLLCNGVEIDTEGQAGPFAFRRSKFQGRDAGISLGVHAKAIDASLRAENVIRKEGGWCDNRIGWLAAEVRGSVSTRAEPFVRNWRIGPILDWKWIF